MNRAVPLTRKNVMLEEGQVQRLVKQLQAKSESEAIRIAIADRLFAEEVTQHIQQLRHRGTLRDAHKREKKR